VLRTTTVAAIVIITTIIFGHLIHPFDITQKAYYHWKKDLLQKKRKRTVLCHLEQDRKSQYELNDNNSW
jgi:hypothetical protein